ncbi:MAG: hypothetical protein KKA81_14885 [Bacteroidetes bacterium]|nr:hypothetical protein [Bacteroidota bacterium]
MFKRNKLRGPVGRIYPITIFSFYILVIVEVIIRTNMHNEGLLSDHNSPFAHPGPVFSITGVALFFAIMGIYQMFRYRLWVYPVLGLLLGFSSLQSLSFFMNSFFTLESYLIGLIVCVIFIILTWPLLKGHELYEAKSRRLFKLAVDSIEEASAGFTARPYSAGSAEYTIDDLQGFGRILKSKHVALPVFRSEGVYFLFSLGISLMTDPEPSRVSYVLFSKDGNISVHISPYDYRQYTKRFTFDQLCNSFARNFRNFLDYYKEGHEERIFMELKSV